MNEIAMQLVTLGQTEAAIKIQTQLEEVNKKWSELQTTTNERQMAFERAHEVQRYNHDAEETRDWILEKYEALTIEDLGKDLRSVQALQRKHEGLYIQGVQGQMFMFQFALTDRNMQARFGLKVFWES